MAGVCRKEHLFPRNAARHSQQYSHRQYMDRSKPSWWRTVTSDFPRRVIRAYIGEELSRAYYIGSKHIFRPPRRTHRRIIVDPHRCTMPNFALNSLTRFILVQPVHSTWQCRLLLLSSPMTTKFVLAIRMNNPLHPILYCSSMLMILVGCSHIQVHSNRPLVCSGEILVKITEHGLPILVDEAKKSDQAKVLK